MQMYSCVFLSRRVLSHLSCSVQFKEAPVDLLWLVSVLWAGVGAVIRPWCWLVQGDRLLPLSSGTPCLRIWGEQNRWYLLNRSSKSILFLKKALINSGTPFYFQHILSVSLLPFYLCCWGFYTILSWYYFSCLIFFASVLKFCNPCSIM